MEFFHCPYCTKFIVVSTSLGEAVQKTLCKKCFKVCFVNFDATGIHIYKEEEVIVNRLNHTIITKKQINQDVVPQLEQAYHELNKKLTEEAQKGEKKDGKQ